MELSGIELILYGLLSGLAEILPISSRAHSAIMLKVLGAELPSNLPVVLIHFAALAAIYYAVRPQLVKMSRARKLASIPKKRRKRPLDICSLMDSRFLFTMIIPVILADILYGKLSQVSFSLLVVSILLFVNGIILYIPQFFPASNKDARSLSRVEALIMGLGGALSIIPGLSGIGICISIAGIAGVENGYALNMTLMMHMAYLAGMIVHDILDIIRYGIGLISFQWAITYFLSAAVAFAGATIAIKLMRSLNCDKGYPAFSFYCWGIALFAFILNLMA